jgi:hypothetical protein
MKLIACLIVLSLIVAFWSTGLASPIAGTGPRGHAVLEQSQKDHAPAPPWWGRDMWVERISPSDRRRLFGKLRAGCKGQRWRKHKCGRCDLASNGKIVRLLLWPGGRGCRSHPRPRCASSSPTVVPPKTGHFSEFGSLTKAGKSVIIFLGGWVSLTGEVRRSDS